MHSNYIPEVRIMSIPNLRYMKVSTLPINRKENSLIKDVSTCVCKWLWVFVMGCNEQGIEKK